MDQTPEEARSGASGLLLPALVLLGAGALSGARLAQGQPLDGLSLALHFAAALAALRAVHPIASRLTAPNSHVGAPAPVSPALVRVTTESALRPLAPTRVSPTQRFDEFVADPTADPAATSLPVGRGWLWTGPYAGLVFAAVLALHALAVPLLRTPLSAAVALICCTPLALWWWRGHRLRRAQKGVAALLAPDQIIVRDALGARSATWGDVRAVTIQTKAEWDTLRGSRRAARLVLERRGAAPLVLRSDDLGMPVERALEWVERYRGAALSEAPDASAADAAGSPASS